MKKTKKILFKSLDFKDSILIQIKPDEDGFCCAILENDTGDLPSEQNELINTIGRGMIEKANNDPQEVFNAGVKGFVKDRSFN